MEGFYMNMRTSVYFLIIACCTFMIAGRQYHDCGDQGCNHGHREIESELRPSALLHSPDYQQPAENPEIKIISQEKVLSGPFMAPRFSADGQYIILTGDNYQGLWIAPRNGSQMPVKISDDFMAGWRPVTTRDSELIYRTAQYDKNTGDITYIVQRYDLNSGEKEEVYRGRNENVYPPQLSRDGEILYILRDGEILVKPGRKGREVSGLSERDEGFSYSDGGRVWYRQIGKDKPAEISGGREACGGEVPSPCGRYIAFLSGDLNAILIHDLETGEEVNIGEGSNLAWYPDGSLLLYDVTSDDGYYIRESDLFSVRPDGTDRQRVTFDPDTAYFNPSWSSEGNHIICEDVLTGEIHLFEVERQGKGGRR